MSGLALAASLIVLSALVIVGFGPSAIARAREWRASGRRRPPAVPAAYDPGRERRAERRARELMRSVVSEEDYAMYVELGFLDAPGADPGYRYLIYPHRPLLAYETGTGRLLSEYCVSFPERRETAFGTRLPAADDVLAKWMSLRAEERELISEANLHLPGRQVDPAQVRRDLQRLRQWRASRSRLAAAVS